MEQALEAVFLIVLLKRKVDYAIIAFNPIKSFTFDTSLEKCITKLTDIKSISKDVIVIE